MKVKVTAVFENDKHVPDNVTTEKLERIARIAWQNLFNQLLLDGGEDETAEVLSCEVMER